MRGLITRFSVPAVAGKNAKKDNPDYVDWRGTRDVSLTRESLIPAQQPWNSLSDRLSRFSERLDFLSHAWQHPGRSVTMPQINSIIASTNAQQQRAAAQLETPRRANSINMPLPSARTFFSNNESIPNAPPPAFRERLATHIMNPNTWVAEAKDPDRIVPIYTEVILKTLLALLLLKSKTADHISHSTLPQNQSKTAARCSSARSHASRARPG